MEDTLANSGLRLGVLCQSEAYSHARRKGHARKLINELADVYLDAYGNAPWNEFLCCSRQGCLGKKSVSEVHCISSKDFVPLKKLEARKPTIPENHRCPLCGESMAFYYSRDQVISMIEKEFSDEVVAALLFSPDGAVVGFCWAWFGDVDAVNWKLTTQFKCSDDTAFVREANNYIKEQGWKRVLFLAEWVVSKPYRNKLHSLLLMQQISILAKKRALSWGDAHPFFIGTSLEGSAGCAIYRKLGGNVVYHDQETQVVIICNPVQQAADNFTFAIQIVREQMMQHAQRAGKVNRYAA
jgi:hypothetical protein